MKRLTCVLLATLCLFSLASCSRAPKIDEIRDRVIELIEASYEINEIFYGAGLPVYDRNDEQYADLYDEYTSALHTTLTKTYDVVRDDAPYRTIIEIKNAAEKVYSKELLEENLYVNAFVGYAITGLDGQPVSSEAVFQEDAHALYQSCARKDLLHGDKRLYDYTTMKITRPSNQKTIYVTMQSWYQSDPTAVTEKRLRLVKDSSGIWYLDSLTV